MVATAPALPQITGLHIAGAHYQDTDGTPTLVIDQRAWDTAARNWGRLRIVLDETADHGLALVRDGRPVIGIEAAIAWTDLADATGLRLPQLWARAFAILSGNITSGKATGPVMGEVGNYLAQDGFTLYHDLTSDEQVALWFRIGDRAVVVFEPLRLGRPVEAAVCEVHDGSLLPEAYRVSWEAGTPARVVIGGIQAMVDHESNSLTGR